MAKNATENQDASDRDQVTKKMGQLEIGSQRPANPKKYVSPALRNQRQSPAKQATNQPPVSNWAPVAYVQPEQISSQSRRFSTSSQDRSSDRPSWHDKHDEAELFGFQKVNTGINFDKYDDIPVSASGNDVPAPVDSFEAGNFHSILMDVFSRAKFTKPTPIQKHAFSIVRAGRDLMACAQTGSGKTGAFLIPIISRMLTSFGGAAHHGRGGRVGMRQVRPKALILAPTRELCQQIYDDARMFSLNSSIKPAAVYGGVQISGQMAQLDRGCDLLVATPGRLVDMIERGKVSLQDVEFLVLDEADKMLDMGFEMDIRRIVLSYGMRAPSAGRNTLMFSATFPKHIQELAREFLNDYIFVTVGKVGASSENIKQKIELVQENEKRSFLLDLLHTEIDEKNGRVLVFVETKKNADMLDAFIYDNNFRSCALHGDKGQAERTEALQMFRAGKINVLVATSVASRGLDIPNVNHVINFELPTDMEDYVHRIGRTGRAGNLGTATTFFTEANRPCAASLIKILQDAKQEVPQWLFAMTASSGFSGFSGGGGSYRGHQGSRHSSGQHSILQKRYGGRSDSGHQQPSYGGGGTRSYSSWD